MNVNEKAVWALSLSLSQCKWSYPDMSAHGTPFPPEINQQSYTDQRDHFLNLG